MTHENSLRTPLDVPLDASFGACAARVSELGTRSVAIECDGSLPPGKRSWLTFRAGGEIFRLPAEVLSCRVDRARSMATGRLHYRGELLLCELPLVVQRDLEELVSILRVDAPAEHMTEALQFEIVGF